MTRPFGVLIPSTNTTVEIECRLVPATYQAHVGRLKSSGGGFSPGPGGGNDFQSRPLGGGEGGAGVLGPAAGRLFFGGQKREGGGGGKGGGFRGGRVI